ncbi:hypothetical protein [Agarivorans gilvus]|jgi:hypothetical protein|uniref:CG2 omega domain protein n=1 Tax=Agarivorans gilvus TaxID=680279 RepID=A0ABQ1HZM4_9ALTE|nr:hypothetical protein [Agarivorans gilvus]GGA97416.1 hypothetical protein GCM10007414_08000 [Agarivorans gilvus]
MKKLTGLFCLLLLPVWLAQADVSVSTDKLEINKDCIRLDGDNVQMQSKDCQSDNKGKGDKENRSVHGDNNPGKGHDKNNKKDKK